MRSQCVVFVSERLREARSVNYPENLVVGGQKISSIQPVGLSHSGTTPTNDLGDASISGSSTAYRKATRNIAAIKLTRVHQCLPLNGQRNCQ